MRLEHFEEWFAIRVDHQDEEFCSSRIIYDPRDGISLDAIDFGKDRWLVGHRLPGNTITGYFDYRRPATVINPWVRSTPGGEYSVNSKVMRARCNIVAAGVLKNIHLQDISERCFTGL